MTILPEIYEFLKDYYNKGSSTNKLPKGQGQECPPTTILMILKLSTKNLYNCQGMNFLQNLVVLVGTGGYDSSL
mgnify:CR=1 FL=1